MFLKGDNFCNLLFAYLEDNGSKFFPLWDDPVYMGGDNENDRVASAESVPIHLKEKDSHPILEGLHCPGK